MNYRKLPKGNELINPLGIGLGAIQVLQEDEIEKIINKAIDSGINFFDLCGGGSNVYRPFGKAIKNRRDKVYFELHFGAVYDENGDYGFSRDLNKIKETFAWEMQMLQTDYVDFGFLHCIDEEEDLNEVINNGILDYVIELKNKNIIRHLGFSSHTPKICNKLLDMKIFDLFLFSINPAYDYEVGDEYGIGGVNERTLLLERAKEENVAISVMKPFFGGKLLSDEHSPFKESLTRIQCLQYALDRPGVIVVVPGIQSEAHLDDVLKYNNATKEELDYSKIYKLASNKISKICVYCNHCHPCPKGINIALVNKYYDLALQGDEMAKNHYYKLDKNASDCIGCGHCDKRCPFKVEQSKKMIKIYEYFEKKIQK